MPKCLVWLMQKTIYWNAWCSSTHKTASFNQASIPSQDNVVVTGKINQCCQVEDKKDLAKFQSHWFFLIIYFFQHSTTHKSRRVFNLSVLNNNQKGGSNSRYLNNNVTTLIFFISRETHHLSNLSKSCILPSLSYQSWETHESHYLNMKKYIIFDHI